MIAMVSEGPPRRIAGRLRRGRLSLACRFGCSSKAGSFIALDHCCCASGQACACPCHRPPRCAPRVRAEYVLGAIGDDAYSLHVLEQARRFRHPDVCPGGRSTWLIAGDDDAAFSPIRVRNIFICIAVAFCPSSRMITAFSRVRPRM